MSGRLFALQGEIARSSALRPCSRRCATASDGACTRYTAALQPSESKGNRAVSCSASKKGRQASPQLERPTAGSVAEKDPLAEEDPLTALMQRQNEQASRASAIEPEPAQQMHVTNGNGSQNGTEDIAQSNGTPPKAESPMDIVFVSSEVAPWSKTGGLGDVMGSLPVAMARRGHRVMVVTPRYLNGDSSNDRKYSDLTDLKTKITLDLGNCGQHDVNFFHTHSQGVDWVFVDHAVYQRAGNPYADQYGAFGDNVFRFSILSQAACEAPLQLNIGGFSSGQPPGFPYGERVLFMANDWHASLVPAYIAAKYRRHGVYKDARAVLAIHNLSHQGVEVAEHFGDLGLPGDWYGALAWEVIGLCGVVGLCLEITTVEGGWGLHDNLASRASVLNGIVNGIDLNEWNPETDEHTPAHYTSGDLSGKSKCKAELQAEVGLPQDENAMLLGFIGRLDHQKGPDVIIEALPGLASRGIQVIILGSGDERYETALRQAEHDYPNNVRSWIGFNVPVSHRIVAGCDALLMPSRFEPCGLNQLFAMRYGTVPIAHATGGLRDTIKTFDPFVEDKAEQGTGWTFSPPDANTMLAAVDNARVTWQDHRESWQTLMRNGMSQDLSWDRSAGEYEQIFQWAMMDPPVAPS
ncbi:hypothetical protein WJX73_007353 [Symbiochloris irregularis]|uniref:starch synthase n=1 Tax=Symbiochloris irregularis TaxID=706552 RepID=A0AAW1NLC5_9CHLO